MFSGNPNFNYWLIYLNQIRSNPSSTTEVAQGDSHSIQADPLNNRKSVYLWRWISQQVGCFLLLWRMILPEQVGCWQPQGGLEHTNVIRPAITQDSNWELRLLQSLRWTFRGLTSAQGMCYCTLNALSTHSYRDRWGQQRRQIVCIALCVRLTHCQHSRRWQCPEKLSDAQATSLSWGGEKWQKFPTPPSGSTVFLR